MSLLEPDLAVTNGGLDANWLVRHGIPTVTFGAGQNNVHTVEEFVDVPEFLRGCRLALALARFLAPRNWAPFRGATIQRPPVSASKSRPRPNLSILVVAEPLRAQGKTQTVQMMPNMARKSQLTNRSPRAGRATRCNMWARARR